jgi:hypothetical protein
MTSHFKIPTSQFEAVKVAIKQDKTGYVLTLSIHPDEVPEEILRDFVGARYQVVMVRLNEDQSVFPRKQRSGVVSAAGILCRDKAFWDFLYDIDELVTKDERSAVEALHRIIGIDSRSELAEIPKAQEAYDLLVTDFKRWKEMGVDDKEPPF